MSDFLATAWHLRYVLGFIAAVTWLAIRAEQNVTNHVAAALNDAAADNAWTDYLDALGLTPGDVRAAYNHREQ